MNFREYLNEGAVGPASFKAGLVLEPKYIGSYANQLGIADAPVFGSTKVKILGVGMVEFRKNPTKKDVQTGSLKDFKKEYKDVWKEYGPRYHSSKEAKLKEMLLSVSKLSDGNLSWIVEILEGERKGQIDSLIFSIDGWSAVYLNKLVTAKLYK